LQLWFCVWTTCTIHSGTFGTSFQTKPFARCFHGWAGVSFGIRGGRNCTNIELWIERQWVKYWGRKRPPKLLYKKWQPRKKKSESFNFFDISKLMNCWKGHACGRRTGATVELLRLLLVTRIL
jgi:hypothetical protein